MNKDEYYIEIKEENKFINISLIKSALNEILKEKNNNQKQNNNQVNIINSNEIFIKDINCLMNTIKILENLIYYTNLPKLNIYRYLKRDINYIYKLASKRTDDLFQKIKITNNESILALFIELLKIYINETNHSKIKKLLIMIMRLIIDNIIPKNSFKIIIEIFINILIIILKYNPDNKFSLNDEPFNFINDIIDSLILFPKEISVDKIDNCILKDTIDIFDQYLITPNYVNICFRCSPIWLKFLENNMINPLIDNEINDNRNSKDKNDDGDNIDKIQDNNDNNEENLQKKLYKFLIKIYKFDMKDDYFQNSIIPKGVINLKYYINSLKYLTDLFNEEEKQQSDSDSSFKILNGFNLQKDNFLYLSNIRLKVNDFSIIFSFKITQIPKDSEEVNILNLYYKSTKSTLYIYLDKNNYLNILINGDKRWNTFIKIKEDKFYLICLCQSKKIIGNSKFRLFINEKINENEIKELKEYNELIDQKEIKGEMIINEEISDEDLCYYFKKKISNLELSKEMILELGKTNFIGIMGEFLIINKVFKKEFIHHLFNLKGNYSKILCQIYNKYETLYSFDLINRNKAKFGINKLNERERKSISFFKEFGYEIKLEIMSYKINRFTKLKYFTQNYYNIEQPSIIKNDKDCNEKNLKYMSIVTNRSGTNSLNNSSIFSNVNSNSISNSSLSNSYFYQKDAFKQENVNVNLSLFKLRHSSEVFYYNQGIDFLTLQLHNIISTVDDQKLLNIYLYETISFIENIMLNMSGNIIDSTVRQSSKLDNKISIFFLTLLTLLNKKIENIHLSNKIILKLLKILDYFRFNDLFQQRNMILSILLEVKFYENQSDIMKYPQLLKTITSDLSNDSNNDITIINNEILYKILMLDFFFELKDYKHKLLSKLISAFISCGKFKQNDDIDEYMTNEFINYFLGLKSETKIYHYLKIIYINSKKIKKKFIKNERFLEYINIRMEKINYNHCKYCAYIQFLCYLIYEEIYINSSSENDYCFHYNPNGFMKNPSIFFMKSVLAQCFDISNENKLKFIKSKLEGIEFILSLIKSNKKNENEQKKNAENKLSKLVGYNKFIPRFKAIVDYIKFLIDIYKESNDVKLLNIIKESIQFIMSFMKQICIERKNNFSNYTDYRKKWSIINSDTFDNLVNESEKRSKENRLIKKYNEFIQELFCCKGMKNFYYIYLNINYKLAIEDIKDFINISISNTFNPFYYYLLSIDLNFDNEINRSYLSSDDDKNINQYILCQLLNLMGTELTKNKIIFDDPQDIILVQNNILLLLYIYQNIINNKILINEEFEKIVILFLNFLLDNYFINSKYIFDINALNNNLKDKSNKKFIVEIIVDILFTLYDIKDYDLKYQYLIKGIFINRTLDLKKIDEQYFLESKNKGSCFKFFNQEYFQNICKGVEVQEILYTIYFLYYLCEKYNKYNHNNNNNNTDNKSKNTDNKNNINVINSDNIINERPLKLINEILISLFTNAIELYNNNFQKIINVRKNLINKYPYKIYKHFLSFMGDKYKEKSCTLDKLIKHYNKLIAKKEINFERKSYFGSEDFLFKKNSLDSTNNKINPILETYTWKKTFGKKEITKKNSFLAQIVENNLEDKPESKKQKSVYIKFNNLESKRSKSCTYVRKKKSFAIKLQKLKSLRNVKQILTFEDSESESENKNNSINDSINDNLNIENKNITNAKNDDNNYRFRKEQSCKDVNKILINGNKEELERIYSLNPMKDKENNDNITIKENDLSIKIIRNIDDRLSDISEEENIVKEYDIQKKLKNINIPSKFYRNIFHLSDSKTMKILFNPKEYFFWNKFTLILKNIIFNDKKFDILTKKYNIIFKHFFTTKNKLKLKYPSKLKNFICDDYYRPFIKPDLNFYKHKLLIKSHSYLNANKNLINATISDNDNLSKIKFERILPINYDLRPTKRIVCELINNSGSIYGHIYLNHAFLLFISDTGNDPRSENIKNNADEEQEEFYLYSYFSEERLKNKKKYIIMYFSEIKEIFIRRFCFNYIGYEIFMKDNRSHLFNFFNKNNLKKFLQIMIEKLEISYKNKANLNNVMIYSNNENILSQQTLNFNINKDINFCVINNPVSIFEKNGYKMKFQKGEISNFKYLLLVNKYSSRTYNDNSQYLVFPLLFMDNEKRRKRDLSKPICLNKDDASQREKLFKENYSNCQQHFNTHYSTCGYILYYLVRLNPFTFGHIKLQSGHFDSPERIFSSLNNYLSAILNSEENREFCPELYCVYDDFINLNHNNIGYIKSDKIMINDFNSNDKSGIFEFIICNRHLLERTNITPWIDNIFGCNQINQSDDLINIFPRSSYEQFNNFEETKKKLDKKKNKIDLIKQIQGNILLLSLGISPIQLFKVNHPLRSMAAKRLTSFFDAGQNNNTEKNIKSLSSKNLNIFVNTNLVNKSQIFCLTNEYNNFGMKLIIKLKNNVRILRLYNNDYNNKNNSIIKFDLWKKKQIKIEPLSKICCELSPGIFCFCRFIDNVIQVRSEKQSVLYQYKCIITSVEFFSHNETRNNLNNNIIHTTEVIFGDELGNINLLQIEYEINIKKPDYFQILPEKTKIMKENKAHNSFIQGILYVKRLNIIISYSEEGQITINNAYSFNIINIIQLGEKYYIKNIKISEYDLLYINCFNNINKNDYIKCYTLNGVKVTKFKNNKKINNYFLNDILIVVYEDNIIEAYNLYDLSKNIYTINNENNEIVSFKQKTNKDNKDVPKKKVIVFSDYCVKDKIIINIFQGQDIFIQDISLLSSYCD